jgi:hypothetical protein
MAQLVATGKWSKTFKNWMMVIAIRRPGKDSQGQGKSGRRTPRSSK